MAVFRGSQNKADIHAVMGSTGTGKGYYIKEYLLPRYVGRQKMVWSVLEETDCYAEVLKCGASGKLSDVIEAWRAGKSFVFLPPEVITKEDEKRFAIAFNLWCRAVAKMKKCVAITEELSRVTTPSWAPPGWSDLSTACRHGGVTLIGTSQRPAQVDKEFLGGVTEIRAFRFGEECDARVMARKLRVSFETLMALPDLHYVHRFVRQARTVSGVLGQAPEVAKKPQKPAQTAKKVTTRKPVKSRKKPQIPKVA